MDRLEEIEARVQNGYHNYPGGWDGLGDELTQRSSDAEYLISRVRLAEALIEEIQRRAETIEYEHLYQWIPKQLDALRDADG